jgi:hypothetical protein
MLKRRLAIVGDKNFFFWRFIVDLELDFFNGFLPVAVECAVVKVELNKKEMLIFDDVVKGYCLI